MQLELSPKRYIYFVLISQILMLPTVLLHRSDGDLLFWHYSERYFVFVIVALTGTLLWSGIAVFVNKVRHVIHAIPARFKLLFVFAAPVIVWLIAAQTNEDVIIKWLWINCCLFIIFIVLCTELKWSINNLYVVAGIVLVVVVLLFSKGVTSILDRPYHPDDAHWLDIMTSPFYTGSLASRTWLRTVYSVDPGIGWGSALVGAIVLNTSVHPYTLRIVALVIDALTLLSSGSLLAYLYDKKVAFTGMVILACTGLIFIGANYRPNEQVIAIAPLLMLLYFHASRTESNRVYFWHFSLGLLSTLAMELHAVALGLALGVAILHLLDAAYALYKGKLRDYIPRIIFYAIGALIGTVIYFAFNVLPAGGITAYLDVLVSERTGVARDLTKYIPPIAERILIFAGFATLFFRRSPTDKAFLRVIAVFVGATLVIDTQIYRPNYLALLLLPAATLITWFKDNSPKRMLIVAMLVLSLAAVQLQSFVSIPVVVNVVKNFSFPSHSIIAIGESIEPHVQHDEVIVSSHELIWTFYDYPHFVSYAAEYTTYRRLGLDNPVDVWHMINPDVIVYLPGRMVLNDGLSTYLEDFELCTEFTAIQNRVEIYRPDC